MQEESFQQYLQRPENRALVESLQKKEQLKSLKKQERATAVDFQAKVRHLHDALLLGKVHIALPPSKR